MKQFKKMFVLLLVLILAVSLIACQNSKPSTEETTTPEPLPSEQTSTPEPTEVASTDPMDMITQGYYSYSFNAPGYGDFVFFFNFYEEDPVLGSVFYAGLSNNRSNFVGTYTVEETPYEYACYPDREASIDDSVKPTTGTAPYTVTFFDWDGNELGKCGYDGDILYNDMEEGSKIYSTGSSPVYYHHDLENKFEDIYKGELGITYLEFVADEDNTSTLVLRHNKTYTDLIGAMIEGTWSVELNASGGYDFKLTPDDSTDTGAVVSVSADRMTCIYTPDGGSAIAMSSTSGTKKVVHIFEGKITIETYKVDATLILNLYDDNTCDISADVMGNSMVLDEGTYVLEGHTFSFDFNSAEDVKSKVDATGTITVPFTISGTKIGDIDTIMTLNRN
jgi:hypothetical protein